jgi:drug/metabolite transporter (DMT)-like permease
MRSPREQEDFLEHGRFGEGDQKLHHTRVDRLVWIGLFFIVAGCACLGSAVIFGIGRDDGGPFFVYGFILGIAVGAAFCLIGFVRVWFRKRTHNDG